MYRWLLLILLLPVVSLAQDTTLELNSERVVSVTAEASAQITFTLDEQQYISLTATAISEMVDPVIWIVDDEQHVRAYNDDIDDTGAANIMNILLQRGRYTAYVDSFNGVSEGEVMLSLQATSPDEITITQSDGEDVVVDGRLLEDSIYRYNFAVPTGEVTITVRDLSGSLDPYLAIYDTDGNILAANDDHQSHDLTLNTFDAQLINHNVSDHSMVIIEVRDFLGRTGQFQIVIS